MEFPRAGGFRVEVLEMMRSWGHSPSGRVTFSNGGRSRCLGRLSSLLCLLHVDVFLSVVEQLVIVSRRFLY